jgi:GT2 family glycosyltransferase
MMKKNTTKIGVGIVTCNREHFFSKCYSSIPLEIIDEFVVINDGKALLGSYNDGVFIQNKVPLHVGESKNILMRHLLDKGCDYIFTLEDDVTVANRDVFQQYINAHLTTGIHHFNFGFSQRENLNENLAPIYRKIIEYKNGTKIILTKHILGAFTFYTRKALQTIGLHHYKFNEGHGDHLELTYRAAKHNFTTPFWWFADIHGSWEMIKNLSNLTTDSTVRDVNTFKTKFDNARKNFKFLHGYDIYEIPEQTESQVIHYLKTAALDSYDNGN